MGMPEMNPLAAKLMGGADYRRELKAKLEQAAEETDDPAYRQRLLEIAEGKRPLRTLMSDPAFAEQVGMRTSRDRERAEAEFRRRLDESRGDPHSLWNGTSEEIYSRVQDRLAAMGVRLPETEELKAVFEDVVSLRNRAESIVRVEQLNAWGGTVERLAERDEQARGGKDG